MLSHGAREQAKNQDGSRAVTNLATSRLCWGITVTGWSAFEQVSARLPARKAVNVMAVSQLQQVRLSVCDRTARLGRERGGREQGRSIQRLSTSRSLASLMPLEQRKRLASGFFGYRGGGPLICVLCRNSLAETSLRDPAPCQV